MDPVALLDDDDAFVEITERPPFPSTNAPLGLDGEAGRWERISQRIFDARLRARSRRRRPKSETR